MGYLSFYACTVGKALACHHAGYGFESLLDSVLFVIKFFFQSFFFKVLRVRVRVRVRVKVSVRAELGLGYIYDLKTVYAENFM